MASQSSTYLHSILDITEVKESKSPWSASLMVINHLHLLQWAISTEHLTQISLLCIQTQTEHTNAPTDLWIFLQFTELFSSERNLESDIALYIVVIVLTSAF